MSQNDKIDNIIVDGINIIEIEVAKLKAKSATNTLTKVDVEQVIEYLKALVIVRKDWRQEIKEEIDNTSKMTTEEIEIELAKAAAEMIKKHNIE